MAIFKYEGIRRDGTPIKGVYVCHDASVLRNDLAKQKIKVFSYTEVKEKSNPFFSISSKVSNKEFVTFVTQLSIMIRAGISIPNAFGTLRNQKFSMFFKRILTKVYDDVLKGMYLSDAMDKHPTVFPSFFTSMVYIGELSGNLADVLDRSTEYYDNDQKMKRKAKSAMIYPIFLLVIVIAVFILLMVVVVPQFVEMIDSFDGEIPTLTKVVRSISDFIVANILYLGGGLFLLIVGLVVFFTKTKAGKKARDYIAFSFPVISKVTRTQITARFCTAFAILLSSGMNVLDCLTAMPKIINNAAFTNKFKQAVVDVNEGEKLARALEKTKLFPPVLVQMTSVGEASSSLDEVYDIVGRYYEEEHAAAVSRAVGMLEPVTIIFLGVMVLVIILSLLLPMFSLMNSIH